MKKEMKIDSYPITLGEIFGFSKKQEFNCEKFIIPGYQRPYEWSEEQLQTALESIENGLSDFNEPLLFGTIHLNKTADYTYEIIDGQQRLTTFSLILRALDKNIKFCPQNEINKAYETDLLMADNDLYDFLNKRYSANYLFIKRHINIMSKEDIENYKEKLFEFIIKRIIFVVIETENNNSIEKTLQIFNSLNTTGLSLDVKDVFKIRFRDYLQKNSAENDEKIFEKINNTYNCVTENYSEKSPYYVSEDDLIETFKLYLLGKEKLEHPAEKLKMSNQKYFEKVFEESNKNASIKAFVEIGNAIKETQMLLEKEDENPTKKTTLFLLQKNFLIGVVTVN